MDTYQIAELMALSPAERATLNCVKVHGQTRATLVGFTTQLGARLCTKSRCTRLMFAKWPHSRCSMCHHPQPRTAQRDTGSAAEQMRDSSKLSRDTRAAVNQDRLDTVDEMTTEGYTIIAPDGTQHFANTVFGKMQRFYHHQLMAFGIRKPLPPPPTGVASYPPQSETTKLADSPLHTLVSLCALLAVLHHVHNTRLFFLPHTHNTHTRPPPSHHIIFTPTHHTFPYRA
jgi:hypothetical protein